jgi:sugar phosphate permease
MHSNRPAIVSALATFILLAIVGFILFVAQLVALNGVIDQSKTSTSIAMGAICQGISLLLASAFAGWFANTLIMKFDWNRATAVIAAVIVGTLLGAAISLISVVVAIPMAGIR